MRLLMDTIVVQREGYSPYTVFVEETPAVGEGASVYQARMLKVHVPDGHQGVFTQRSNLPPPPTARWLIDWTLGTVSVSPIAITVAHSLRIAAAADRLASLMETGVVTVTTTAGTYNYGTDEGTQTNITQALIGVALAITPNPRPWTPKGARAPISVTHDDLRLIGGTLGARKDAMVAAYMAHKNAIRALTTADAVAAYDVTVGWPNSIT
jgi:hypothetical protein